MRMRAKPKRNTGLQENSERDPQADRGRTAEDRRLRRLGTRTGAHPRREPDDGPARIGRPGTRRRGRAAPWLRYVCRAPENSFQPAHELHRAHVEPGSVSALAGAVGESDRTPGGNRGSARITLDQRPGENRPAAFDRRRAVRARDRLLARPRIRCARLGASGQEFALRDLASTIMESSWRTRTRK